jgi:hypothetical protein
MQTIKTPETAVAATSDKTPRPNGPTTQFLAQHFAAEIAVQRKAMTQYLEGGIAAVAYSATLAWQGAAMGADSVQIAFLLLGKEKPAKDGQTGKDTAEAKVYRQAKRLAMHWRTKGAPDGFPEAQSFEAGYTAARAWLTLKDIRSVDGLHFYLSGEHPQQRKESTVAETTGKRIAALVKDGKFSVTDATQLGAAIVGALGDEFRTLFAEAVAAKASELAIARAAAEAAAEATPATPEAAAA